MTNPFLIGERVYLRPFEPDDARRAAAWMNDRVVTERLAGYLPWSVARERQALAEFISPEHVGLGVCLRESDELIGASGLSAIDHRDQTASFGIVIGYPEQWGKGLGTEVTRLVRDFGFEDLNLNRIALRVDVDNAAGIAAYERAGFRREGHHRQARFRRGRHVDEYSMAIVREDWKGAGS